MRVLKTDELVTKSDKHNIQQLLQKDSLKDFLNELGEDFASNVYDKADLKQYIMYLIYRARYLDSEANWELVDAFIDNINLTFDEEINKE